MRKLRDLDAVATRSLRLVELLVGAAEEIFRRVPRLHFVRRQGGDADRGADRKSSLLADREQAPPEAFREEARRLCAGLREQHDEFVAAIASGEVGVTEFLADRVC